MEKLIETIRKDLLRREPDKQESNAVGYCVVENILFSTDHRRMFYFPTEKPNGFYLNGKLREPLTKIMDFSRIIPKTHDHEYMMDVAETLQALRITKPFWSRNANYLGLEFSEFTLKFCADCADNGRDYSETGSCSAEMDCHRILGADFSIHLNGQYLLEWFLFLARQKIDSYTVKFTTSNYPALFQAGIYSYILMPMAF